MAFEKSVLFSDAKPVYRLNLAIFYASQEIYDKALEFAKISPRDDSWYSLFSAWLYVMLDKNDEAEKIIDELIKSKNLVAEAYNLRAYMLFKSGKMDDALRLLDRVSQGDSSDLVNYNKAFLNLHLNNYDEAEKIIDDIVKNNPNYYKAWLAQAILSFIKHDEAAAVEALNGAKKLKHAGFKSWLKKASSASNSSDSEESLKALLDCVAYATDIDLKFYIPEMFSLSYNDTVGFFAFDRLDAVFMQKNM